MKPKMGIAHIYVHQICLIFDLTKWPTTWFHFAKKGSPPRRLFIPIFVSISD